MVAGANDIAAASGGPGMPKAARKLLIGLIGAGIQRSLSPAMHEQEAREQGLRLHYQLIDVERSADRCCRAAATDRGRAHRWVSRA